MEPYCLILVLMFRVPVVLNNINKIIYFNSLKITRTLLALVNKHPLRMFFYL